MKRFTNTIFTIGMMMTGISTVNPVFANESKAYKVSYDDKEDMKQVFKDMYSSKIGKMKYGKTETKMVHGQTEKVMTYESDKYKIQVDGLDLQQEGTQSVTMTLSNKDSKNASSTVVDHSAVKNSTTVIDAGMVASDKATIQVVSEKPIMNISNQNIETIQGKALDLNNYVTAEDADHKKLDVTFSGNVDYNQIGTYQVTASAAGAKGKSVSKQLTVEVKQDEFYQQIADVALSQIGVEQDCTMLVTNSLKAVGINFHGWPEEYLSLGTVTDTPVPGDICVYSGHVAIYIGNGQAVHGGWLGHTTVVSSVNCDKPLIGYVHVSH